MGGREDRRRHQKKLLAKPRQAFIRATKVYATASTDFSSVVTRVLLVDLFI